MVVLCDDNVICDSALRSALEAATKNSFLEPTSFSESNKVERAECQRICYEFLQWARRLREAEIDSYRPLFAKVDADASGYIDHKELT
eukprot:5109631-Amphidinium_carterae.1